MALQATRLEYRITLSHVDRAIDLAETSVIVARHPSETQEHVTLRVLSWCLLQEEGITFGPGISSDNTADLWVHDLTGRLTTWIECGATRWDHLRKALHQHGGAQAHVVFSSERKRTELLAEIADTPHAKDASRVTLWSIDPALVTELATRDARRQKWSVTIVGDHFYIEIDGKSFDGDATPAPAA
ncbi:MAG: YaeQ family protein [Polyangiales bacterium]